MRVLLISVVTENLNMVVLPLGMACVAAATQKAGHTVRQISIGSETGGMEGTIHQEIAAFDPQVIGISMRNIDDQSMTTRQFLVAPVKAVVSECRKHTDAKIVLGGAGYSIFPRRSLAYTGADMGIAGEGEAAFVQLLACLDRQQNISAVPGLFLPDVGPAIPFKFPKTLDDYPMPLPDVHLAIPEAVSDEPVWVPLQTRRGCPMDCSYCSTSTIEGRILRKHSPEKVVENIKQYVAAGYRHIQFVDNTFNFPSSYAAALCDGIIEEGLNIRGRCIVYPSRIGRGLVRKMARAGIREVSLGFESGCDALLKTFNKRFATDEVRQVAELFRAEKIFQMGFLLLGGPGETKQTVLESLAFADALDLDFGKISVGIRIYPHTELAKIAMAEGKITPETNLLFPTFYVVDEIRDWLYRAATEWVDKRPNWMM